VLAAVIDSFTPQRCCTTTVVDESDLREVATSNPPSATRQRPGGDFLYSRAFQMMVDVDHMRVMRILADATNRLPKAKSCS